MIEYKKYFIVGTNDNALHDTMNGNVTGELIRCKDCKHQRKEYHDDKGRIDDGYYIRGYFIYWCEKANGYSPLGFDNQYCSEADRKETK